MWNFEICQNNAFKNQPFLWHLEHYTYSTDGITGVFWTEFMHTYITSLTRECQFQWERTLMNIVIAIQTVERWKEAECTVYLGLSAYLTNWHRRILEVWHQHSLIRLDIPTLMQTNHSTTEEHTYKLNNPANRKPHEVWGSCGSRIRCCVVWYMGIHFLEDHATSIFKEEEYHIPDDHNLNITQCIRQQIYISLQLTHDTVHAMTY
jgi:hypothetical protein